MVCPRPYQEFAVGTRLAVARTRPIQRMSLENLSAMDTLPSADPTSPCCQRDILRFVHHRLPLLAFPTPGARTWHSAAESDGLSSCSNFSDSLAREKGWYVALVMACSRF